MQHLIRAVQARLKQRKLFRPAVGLIIKELCKPYAVDPSTLQVTIYRHTCTIILSAQEDKTTRFLQKAQLLEKINKKLADDGREVQVATLRIK